jgi:metallo-beta-lactamase family protein
VYPGDVASIQFLGAAGTVTGSRHLLEHRGKKLLMDCGLFQGDKQLRQRNWEPCPVSPRSIDAVVLSHAHIDHTGWLPRLVKEGFAGPVYTTPATRDLSAIMLPDSGHLQEEEARYANKKGYSKHAPALPLYTEEDAAACIPRMKALPYGDPIEILPGMRLSFRRAGHILGSAIVIVDLDGDGPARRVVFSGDLGRPGTPIIPDPDKIDRATALLVECTYGDRIHDQHDPQVDLEKELIRLVAEKGVLIIPAFAIGRTQQILHDIRVSEQSGAIPPIPVVVDSPMACSATPLYLMHREEHDDEMRARVARGEAPLQPEKLWFARSVEQSKAINERKGPLVIVSASGMATGGRVLHHLARRLPDPSASVIFVGYQAVGTRGARLLGGEKTARIHGQEVPVRARIGQIHGFSGHADQRELDGWLGGFQAPPAQTYLVHGEPGALETMRARLAGRGWPATVPAHGQTLELPG